MISGIGINGFFPAASVGVGPAAPTSKPEPEKQTEDKNTARRVDPVPVKPANIGGGSAIAAQIEASRPETSKNAGKEADTAAEIAPERTSDDTDAAGLTEEERAQVRKLSARDREVRAHEAAHKAAGGPYTGAASFTFQNGPDGRRYAVGGEVPIDVSSVPGDPDATIRKLRTVRRAALAPAEPSAQDRSIASTAEAGVRAAQAEKRSEVVEELQGQGSGENAPSTALAGEPGQILPEGDDAADDDESRALQARVGHLAG